MRLPQIPFGYFHRWPEVAGGGWCYRMYGYKPCKQLCLIDITYIYKLGVKRFKIGKYHIKFMENVA